MHKAIGLDIGGTKIALAAVDSTGVIHRQTALPTQAEPEFGRAVEAIAHAIAELLTQAGWQLSEIDGIGIGCAGPVNPKAGTIDNPFTLPGWQGCDIVSPLHRRFGVPVYLENDADAAVMGELHFGAGQGSDAVVMLTFGTGVGGAVIQGGRIVRGVNGAHPELGHLVVDLSGPDCYCGAKGCLESLASGTAILNSGRQAGFEDARQVFAGAAGGHSLARTIVRRAITASTAAAWTIFHTLLPECLILGGGIMEEHFELFAAPIRQHLASATQIPAASLRVLPAALGNRAGLVGSANIAFAASGVFHHRS